MSENKADATFPDYSPPALTGEAWLEHMVLIGSWALIDEAVKVNMRKWGMLDVVISNKRKCNQP